MASSDLLQRLSTEALTASWLAQRLAQRFDLEWEFLPVENPV